MRVIKGLFCLYLWLSNVLVPVTNGPSKIGPAAEGEFWNLKVHQLLTFGTFDDLPHLLGRGILPFFVWAIVDYGLRRQQRSAVK